MRDKCTKILKIIDASGLLVVYHVKSTSIYEIKKLLEETIDCGFKEYDYDKLICEMPKIEIHLLKNYGIEFNACLQNLEISGV